MLKKVLVSCGGSNNTPLSPVQLRCSITHYRSSGEHCAPIWDRAFRNGNGSQNYPHQATVRYISQITFLGRLWRPYIVFTFNFLFVTMYVCMYIFFYGMNYP